MKKTLAQFATFSAIGAVGTAVHYSLLLTAVELLGITPLYGTTAGFIAGAMTNYLLNYHITFRSNKRHAEALAKFVVVAIAGAILNVGVMYAGTTYLQLYYIVSQIIATTLVLLWNFAANRLWTFSTTRQTPQVQPDNRN